MRWWSVLCVAVLWSIVTSQPTKEPDNVQEQSGTRQCCPCPTDLDSSSNNGRSSLTFSEEGKFSRGDASSRGMGSTSKSSNSTRKWFTGKDNFSERETVEDQEPFGTTDDAVRTALDDCPCRARSVDTEGSPSNFLPSAMRALRPFVSHDDDKDEKKPLLHPEVDFASSVLHTLREATDEEYEEALARDAVRSLTRAAESEETSEQSPRNILNFASNPEAIDSGNDDIVPESSHIQESRCVHPPLGKSNLRKVPTLNPPSLLTDILNLPHKKPSSFKKLFDMDSTAGASDLNEYAVAPPTTKSVDEKRFRSQTDPLNLLFKNDETNDDKKEVNENSDTGYDKGALSKIPQYIPKLNFNRLGQSKLFKPNGDIKTDSSSSATNNVNSAFNLKQDLKERSEKVQNTLARLDNASKKLFELNTLLSPKKEVDSSSNSIIKKGKIANNVPQLNLLSDKQDATSNVFNNFIEGLGDTINKNLQSLKNNLPSMRHPENKKTDVLQPPNEKPITTEILDVIPSASVIKTSSTPLESKTDKSNEKNLRGTDNMNTQIISSRPSPAGIIPVKNDNNSVEEEILPHTKIINFVPDVDSDTINSTDGFNEEIQNNDDTISKSNENISGIIDESDSQADTTNNAISTMIEPEEDTIDTLTLLDESENVLDSKDIPPNLSQNLQPFRERLSQKLNKLSSSETPVEKAGTHNKINDVSKPIAEKDSSLSFDELQKMSDSLLDREESIIDAMLDQEIKDDSVPLKNSKNVDNFNSNEVAHKHKDEIGCLTHTDKAKSIDSNDKSKDMTSEASEPVVKKIKPFNYQRSSLLPIVQPLPSIFNTRDNLFHTPVKNVADLFQNPLPALKIPNIFDSRDRNNKIKTVNFKDISRSNDHMSSLASAPKLRTALPALQPLEDFNLDIFQLNPLSSTNKNAIVPNVPRLNLNSFKSKLALPKSLDLKPVSMKSSISNREGIDGASLRFGDKNKLSGRKPSSAFTPMEILGNPVELPKLHDLRENFLENAHNLLSTPLEVTSNNLIDDTLRSTQVLSENFKVHAKKTMKDLQKNVESTFKQSKLPSSGVLGNPLTTSSDLFNDVAIKHDDLTDKLKGIHYDLSDRLETIRNDFLDQFPNLDSGKSSILTLGQPLFRLSDLNKDIAPVKQKNKKTQGKFKFSSPSKETSRNKPLKMLGASSSLTPKTLEYRDPKLSASPMHSFQREPIFRSSQPSLRDRLDGLPKPKSSILNKPLLKSKLGENKVKISFVTTPRPIIKSEDVDKNWKIKSSPFTNNKLTKSKGKIIEEQSGSSSERMSSKLKLPSKSLDRTAPKDSLSSLKSNIGTSNIKPILQTPLYNNDILKTAKALPSPQIKLPKPDLDRSLFRSNEPQFKLKSPVHWPQNNEDSFLSKVREAVQARLSNFSSKTFKPLSETKLAKTEPGFDMARSASTNQESIISPATEIMKENTSYTCNMFCTKNS